MVCTSSLLIYYVKVKVNFSRNLVLNGDLSSGINSAYWSLQRLQPLLEWKQAAFHQQTAEHTPAKDRRCLSSANWCVTGVQGSSSWFVIFLGQTRKTNLCFPGQEQKRMTQSAGTGRGPEMKQTRRPAPRHSASVRVMASCWLLWTPRLITNSFLFALSY